MSILNLSADATDKLFLEYILPGLNVEIRENTTVYDRFKTDTQHMAGKYAVFKALTASPKSARPSSSTTMPTAKQGTYDEFILYMKRGMYAQLQFDNLAIACGKGEGAVMDVLESEIQAITIYMSNKLNKQFWGDGSGRLAQLSAATSNDPTVVINGPSFGQDSNYYTNPGNYIADGMGVDIYDTSGNLEAEDVEISSLTDSGDGTATMEMTTSVTASNDSWIFDHDTYAASQAAGTGVPQGLSGIIEATDPLTGITSTDFQGVDRATNTWAQAQEVDMEDGVFTNRKILELVQECEKFGRVNALITNAPIWNSMYEKWEADKMMPNEKAYWGGTEGLAFYGGRKGKIPIIYDTDCPDNQIFAIDDSVLKVYAPTKNGMTWLPGDNGILTHVQGKDETVASLVWYYNFGTTKPRALGKLYDVKHAAT